MSSTAGTSPLFSFLTSCRLPLRVTGPAVSVLQYALRTTSLLFSIILAVSAANLTSGERLSSLFILNEALLLSATRSLWWLFSWRHCWCIHLEWYTRTKRFVGKELCVWSRLSLIHCWRCSLYWNMREHLVIHTLSIFHEWCHASYR